VNGIYAYYSGPPFTITASSADLNMPGNPQVANMTGDYKVIGDKGQAGYYFDPAAFSQPQGAQFGNTERNQFRAPSNWNVDFSIFRAFPIGGGGKRLEFRTEFFNLFNHPMWGIPVTDVNNNSFGRVLQVGGDGRGNGSARDSGSGERQIRFGLRFSF
jgi:hypothetical protein